MSKTQAAAQAPETLPQPTEADEVLTAEQWGLEASRGERRVEMLNGFLSVESGAGRFTRTRAEWARDFAAFANRPL